MKRDDPGSNERWLVEAQLRVGSQTEVLRFFGSTDKQAKSRMNDYIRLNPHCAVVSKVVRPAHKPD